MYDVLGFLNFLYLPQITRDTFLILVFLVVENNLVLLFHFFFFYLLGEKRFV